MARAFLVWEEAGAMRAGEIDEDAETVVGRGDTAHVVLADSTVSRTHAALSIDGDGLLVKNLSRVNVTRLNGSDVASPARAKDGDVLEIGSVHAVLHDLAASDGIADVSCSHCQRANEPTQPECWYCGTSLVNAPTVMIERRRALCRIVGAGAVHNLMNGKAIVFDQAGAPTVVDERAAGRPAGAAIVADGPVVSAIPGAHGPSVNGRPISEPAPLRTGDELSVGSVIFVALIR